MSHPGVVCVGQAVVDCVTIAPEELTPTNSRAESITLSAGGDAVNQSVAIAQMGHSAAAAIALGCDAAGDIVEGVLASHGVDLSRVVRMPQPFQTPVANLLVSPDGSRRSISSRAAQLPGYAPDPAAIAGARVVSLASLFRAPFLDPAAVLALARAAKETGAVLVADTKLPIGNALGLDDLRETLALVDYLFPNEVEAAYLTGASDLADMASALLAAGVGCAVVKAGERGCYVASAEGAFALPALDCEVVDTTGAGDHFAAGFICALLEGADLEACALAGRALASESLAYPGGIMP